MTWQKVDKCKLEAGEQCQDGVCKSACELVTRGNVGCSFYPVNLWSTSMVGKLGIVVTNTSDRLTATVTLEDAAGVIETQTIPPAKMGDPQGGMAIFRLDHGRNKLTGTELAKKGFHLSSTAPVAVYQFHPIDAATVFSGSATLLLPEHVMAKNYFVMSYTYNAELMTSPPQGQGFVAVVGLQDGTLVEVTSPVATSPAPGVAGLKPGETLKVRLINDLPPNRDWMPKDITRPHQFNNTNFHFHGAHCSPGGIADNVMRTMLPGKAYDIEIALPADHTRGTYWYHPHAHETNTLQVGHGLAAPLIVRSSDDPLQGLSERTLMVTSLGLDSNAQIMTGSTSMPGMGAMEMVPVDKIELPAGEAVGYAGTWTAAVPSRIGIAAMGYGDGYPRHAGSGTPVLVDGRPAALVGRVSMDMLAIDLVDHPEAQVGTPVTLWGQGLPVETIADHAGTIAYELLCAVAGRVHVHVQDLPHA